MSLGNIHHAMRQNYNEYGVDEYYRKVSSSYRNPFLPSIKQVIWAVLSSWYTNESISREVRSVRVLDMAAGSGEVTICLNDWVAAGKRTRLRDVSERAFVPPARVKQTMRCPDEGFVVEIAATDPFTSDAYLERTGSTCSPLSFAQLAQGSVPEVNPPPWDFVICSFALHLVPTSSELFALLYELSIKATWLVVVSPHKKPEIKDGWGWQLWDINRWAPASTHSEIVRDK